MPISAKQFMGKIKQRRAAVQDLRIGAVASGIQERMGAGINGGGRTGAMYANNSYSHSGDPFSPQRTIWNASPRDQMNEAKAGAMKSGLSAKKVNKVVNRSMKKAAKAGTFNKAEIEGRKMGGHSTKLDPFRG